MIGTFAQHFLPCAIRSTMRTGGDEKFPTEKFVLSALSTPLSDFAFTRVGALDNHSATFRLMLRW